MNPESENSLYNPHSNTSVLDARRASSPSKTRRPRIVTTPTQIFPSLNSQACSPDTRREPVLVEPGPHPGAREADTRDAIDLVQVRGHADTLSADQRVVVDVAALRRAGRSRRVQAYQHATGAARFSGERDGLQLVHIVSYADLGWFR